MIVPAGIMGLDDSLQLRRLLTEFYGFITSSTYAIRPSKLFDGVDQRLCIFLGGNAKEQRWFASKYYHWNTEERSDLFSRLAFETSRTNRLGRIPQLGSVLAEKVLNKIEEKAGVPVAASFSDVESHYLNYHRSPRYWIRAMNFEPYFKSASRDRSVHHLRELYIGSASAVGVIGSILNSSLFFFWFISVGNGRNITSVDVASFPVGALSSSSSRRLDDIFTRLMEHYRANSRILTRRDCEFQEFRPALSKPIIDEIDAVLGDHYGFTADELDFIINYEIKYRLGADQAEE